MQETTRRTTCRVCNSPNLTHLFSLGTQYVSDFIDEDDKTERIKCPINLLLCNECTLVQQEYTAPQEILYSRHYWYKSGTTETMRNALKDIVDSAMRSVYLEEGDIVLDIGSNDGTLLRCYPDTVFTVGFEPATNFALSGREGVSYFVNDFWSKELYHLHKAKIVTAIGMFYDLEDPNQFVADIAAVLHPEGVFVAQLMCLKQTVERADVGNFAHEHLEFYSLRSLKYLLGKHGLCIYDIEENYINGGSYRIYIKHWEDNSKVLTPRMYEAIDEEERRGLNQRTTYDKLFERMERTKMLVVEYINKVANEGKLVCVYGASTKGNVILQYYGLDRKHIVAAIDKSEEKIGKRTVGSGIKIFGERVLQISQIDYLLILPWAFVNEFAKREQVWLEAGGTFIVPLPYPHTIEADQVDVAVKHLWYPTDRMPLLKVRALI